MYMDSPCSQDNHSRRGLSIREIQFTILYDYGLNECSRCPVSDAIDTFYKIPCTILSFRPNSDLLQLMEAEK